ncbi:hypothetical protein ABK040_000021 [Willaertia magna]
MFMGHFSFAPILYMIFNNNNNANNKKIEFNNVPFLCFLMISTQINDIFLFVMRIICHFCCNHNFIANTAKTVDNNNSDNVCNLLFCFEKMFYNKEWILQDRFNPITGNLYFTHSLTGTIIMSLFLTLLAMPFLNDTLKNIKFTTRFYNIFIPLFLGSLSHYLLDVLTHRKDMYLFTPLHYTTIGLYLWDLSKYFNCSLEIFLSTVPFLFYWFIFCNNETNKKENKLWKEGKVFIIMYLTVSIVMTCLLYFDPTVDRVELLKKRDGEELKDISLSILPLVVYVVCCFAVCKVETHLGRSNKK